jgi:hypothetical protein
VLVGAAAAAVVFVAAGAGVAVDSVPQADSTRAKIVTSTRIMLFLRIEVSSCGIAMWLLELLVMERMERRDDFCYRRPSLVVSCQ